MNQFEYMQLVAEAVLEFKTAIKNDNEVEEVGALVLDIVTRTKDQELIHLVEEAHNQLPNAFAATQCLNEAQSYLSRLLDHMMSAQ